MTGMQWVLWMIAVAILGLAAVAASGRLGELPATVTDTPRPHVPHGLLNGDDLRGLRFAVVPRGYSMEQVDELLDRLARQLDGTRGGQPGPVSSEHDPERTGSVTEVAESEPSIVEPSASERQPQAATPTVKTAPAESQPNVSQTAPSASQPGSSDASDARPERLE